MSKIARRELRNARMSIALGGFESGNHLLVWYALLKWAELE